MKYMCHNKKNSQKDFTLTKVKKTLAITMNTLAIEARAKDMGEIVFFAIGVRAKKDAERKCENKSKEEKKNKRFRVGE
jgi:proteasome assembly chaperone (PAC2) family protein